MDISSNIRSHSFDETSKKLIKDISFFNSLESFDLLSEYHERIVDLERESFDLLIENNNIKQSDSRLEVAVIGNFSSGKSSLVNSLLGKNVCPDKVNPTTSSVTKFLYSDKPSVYIVRDKGDSKSYEEITPEEYFVMSQHASGNTSESKVYFFEYHYPFDGFRGIALYDTPGFENPLNNMDERITQDIASQVDVLFVILDVNTGDVSEKLLNRINNLKTNSKHRQTDFYLILNKADTKSPKSLADMKVFFESKYGKYFDSILEYSAKEVLDNTKDYFGSITKIFSDTIQKSVYERKAFEFSVHGKIEGRVSKKFEISIDGNKINIPVDTSSRFIESKVKLLEILNRLTQKKEKILFYRFERQFDKHERKIAELIDKIGDKCYDIILSDDNTNDYRDYFQNIIDKIREFHENTIKNFDFFDYNAIYRKFAIKAVSNDEKAFWFNPYYKI